MSLSQTLTRRRDADLLQRALDGDRDALDHPLLRDESGELAALLRLSSELPRPRVAPDQAFVERLRDQLVAETAHRPLLSSVDERTAEVSRTPAPAGPRMLTVPRSGRLLAGLAAAVVLVAAVLGGLSTRALPGDTLYPVKLMIGDAQVRLAGSDIGRGRALLAQVDTRLDEVDGLVAAGNPPPSLVDETLTRASDDLGDAQRELLTTDSGSPDPRAIQLLADAGAQATGRLAALRDRVPLASVPAVDHLLQQLAQARAALLQQLDRLAASGRCGDVCDSVRSTLEQQGTELRRLLGSTGSTPLAPGIAGPGSGQAGSGGPAGLDGRAPAAGSGLPTSAPSVSLPGVTLPGVTVSGPSVGGGGGGLTASLPGGTVSVPGASVGLPSVGVTVPTTSTTGLPLPGVTVDGTTPTLGPVTVPVPGVSVGGGCVTLLCLGG